MTHKLAMTIILVVVMASLFLGFPENLLKKRVPPISDTLIVSLTPGQKRLLCLALINNADRRSSDGIAELAYKLGVGKELGDLLNDFIKKISSRWKILMHLTK